MNETENGDTNNKKISTMLQILMVVLVTSVVLLIFGTGFNSFDKANALPVKIYDAKINKKIQTQRSGKSSEVRTYIYIEGVTKNNKHVNAFLRDNKAPSIHKSDTGVASATIYKGDLGYYSQIKR